METLIDKVSFSSSGSTHEFVPVIPQFIGSYFSRDELEEMTAIQGGRKEMSGLESNVARRFGEIPKKVSLISQTKVMV